jgi:hypothetical protein
MSTGARTLAAGGTLAADGTLAAAATAIAGRYRIVVGLMVVIIRSIFGLPSQQPHKI